MRRAITGFQLAVCLAMLSAAPAFSQITSDEATATVAAPVAHVYVQTGRGVMAYSAAANGALTPVNGSPFPVAGQMEDISAKHLISVGNTYLHTYPINANGSVGKQIYAINTADYMGSQCGGTSGQGSVLDHTGKYLYVQLNTLNTCAAWQTYQVEANGYLQFIGDVEYDATDEGGDAISSSVPTISSNDKFGYGVFPDDPYAQNFYCEDFWIHCPYFSAFTRSPWQVFEQNYDFRETDPQAPSGMGFIPSAFANVQADSTGHLAALMTQSNGGGVGNPPQVASFTIDPSNGSISSSNTYLNMPYVQENGDDFADGPIVLAMSPSGKLLAMGGDVGLYIFHFNGAGPATHFGNRLVPSFWINRLKWDKNNHLYALSYDSTRLFVFTVTPTSIKEAPGSPYHVPNHPYGITGLIVTP
jgi:hypothetical protein